MSHSIYCPHCHRFTYLTSKCNFGNQTGEWDTSECNACHKVVLIHKNMGVIYPSPLPKAIDQRIIKTIRTDFAEAILCFSVEAYRAASVMARRALQNICLDKGAKESDKLEKQIDWLFEQAIVTKELKEWAHEVRLVGNNAAHPKKPDEDIPVSKEDADDILKLLEQFCQVLYVAPTIASEMRKSRQSTKRP